MSASSANSHGQAGSRTQTFNWERDIWAAELGDAPTIDLHGMSINLAITELETFLHQELMRSTHVIKIVHGLGSGALEKAVRAWLSEQKQLGLVPFFRAAETSAGVTYAVLEQLNSPSN